MTKTSILVVGAGGREHALAKQYAKSSHVNHVFVAPGNPGMVQSANEYEAAISCVAITVEDIEALLHFAKEEAVSLTFVGPEVPLNLGIVDRFSEEGLAVVGPTKEAAQLESSKAFAKAVMEKADVKTAAYRYFKSDDFDNALDYLAEQSFPIVLKEDGLAQGKGVTISSDFDDAKLTLKAMMTDHQSDVIIEECLVGEEFSYFVLVNGQHTIPVGTARDYKRVGDGDKGLNTGGMGAYAPVDWADELLDEVNQSVIQPVIDQMVSQGCPFTGVLYAGLMKTEKGIYVIEFNTRFGDPETQILLPLIEDDFYDVTLAHINQQPFKISLSDQKSLGVVLAAKGYPKDYERGMPIQLTDETIADAIRYAGVSKDADQLVANGGRILMVTAQANEFSKCRDRVYEQLTQLTVPNSFYRNDIGLHQ